MGSPTVTVLAIDDDPLHLELVRSALSQLGLQVLTTTDPQEGLKFVRTWNPQIVLMDPVMPGMDEMKSLDTILEWNPATDVILIACDYSTEAAVAAIQKGARDYMEKPIRVQPLRQKVEALVLEATERERGLRLGRELQETCEFTGMVGHSPLMQELFSTIARVAPHFQTVLVTGASGTGKELVARSLHKQSPRASKPIVFCNCSAIMETLFESELFGYARGAFTGAVQDKPGLWETANGGVLVLDEIGDVPLTVQAKLLRALQNQEIQRVGSPVVRRVDVRVVAATNRDLRAMVAARQFREDLYYRLSMVELHVPSLVERKEDVGLLQRHFVELFSRRFNKPVHRLTRRAAAALARHSWPGNVRELENVIGHACMMTNHEVLDVHDLPKGLRMPVIAREDPLGLPLAEVERRYARRVLDNEGGNKLRAAAILGIGRSTLYRLLADDAGARSKHAKTELFQGFDSRMSGVTIRS